MEQKPLRTGGELEETILRYQNMVYGLALARTGSPADADDVFQETFLAYYRAGKTFREEEHRKAWLLRPALNLSRRVTQSTYRRKVVPLEEGEDPTLFIADPGITTPEDEDLIAIEPQIKDLPSELPETKEIKYDLPPSLGE